ncbi:MAG: transcription elongation factor GreA [Sediminibacterium sp.]|nr:transcription elongation factor GreA [Sediminibacterium sp.]
MLENTMYVTQESYDKLMQELHHMKAIERPNASKAIAEAREKGDLKENAEYDSAKEAQGMLEAKIKYLENAIATAKIISPEELDLSKVTVLSRVTVTNLNLNKVYTYQIVSEKEANFKEAKISSNSPIGKGLIGKQVDEIAEIQTPSGIQKLRIDKISL